MLRSAIWFVIGPAMLLAEFDVAKEYKLKTLEYIMPNGARVIVTDRGQLIGWGAEKGCGIGKKPCPVDTFAFSRIDEKTKKKQIFYDALTKKSRVSGSKEGDLIGVSLSGPPSGTKIQPGKPITARAVFDLAGSPKVRIGLEYTFTDKLVKIQLVKPEAETPQWMSDSCTGSSLRPSLGCIEFVRMESVACHCDPPIRGELRLVRFSSKPADRSSRPVIMDASPADISSFMEKEARLPRDVQEIQIPLDPRIRDLP